MNYGNLLEIYIVDVAVILIIVTIIWLIIKCFVKSRRKPDEYVWKEPPKYGSDIYHRTAVHESGHLLLAWRCTAVSEVFYAEINERKIIDGLYSVKINNGNVLYELLFDKQESTYWARAIITMGGIAAESLVYRSFHSGPAKKDLCESYDAIDIILSLSPNFKLNEIPKTSIDFSKAFSNQISERHNQLLRLAYDEAKFILSKNNVKFFKSISALLSSKKLEEKQLENILGDRFSIKVLNIIGRVGFL